MDVSNSISRLDHERGPLAQVKDDEWRRSHGHDLPQGDASRHSTSSDGSLKPDEPRSRLLPSRQTTPQLEQAGLSLGPQEPSTWRVRCRRLAAANQGILLMVTAQFFAALMSTIARLLEIDAEIAMRPFQVLLARMSITVVASLLYMRLAKVPDAPFGKKEVRALLVLRGVGGFFGVFGLYVSLIDLPLAEALVITFLGPILAAWILSLLGQAPFTGSQKLAGFLSLVGVVLIARPTSFFNFSAEPPPPVDTPSTAPHNATDPPIAAADAPLVTEASPARRAVAVCFALLGVVGAASAYTSLTVIGKRAHALISVTYFSAWCTLVSAVALAVAPDVPAALPTRPRAWLLVAALGASGFANQLLMTKALASRQARSGSVLNFVYVQVLFALGFDRLVFGTQPGWLSALGGALILGSSIWVAVQKDRLSHQPRAEHEEADEMRPMHMARQRGSRN